MFTGMIEVHDLHGVGETIRHHIPSPFGTIAEKDDVFRRRIAVLERFAMEPRAEVGYLVKGGDINRRGGVALWLTLGIQRWSKNTTHLDLS